MLSTERLHAKYKGEATDLTPEVEYELRRRFEGFDQADFDFGPDARWSCKLVLGLRDPRQLDAFFVQGHREAVKPGEHPEGLLIETPDLPFVRRNREKQVYLWTHQNFEGNLYVEFEWQSLKPTKDLSTTAMGPGERTRPPRVGPVLPGMGRAPFLQDSRAVLRVVN